MIDLDHLEALDDDARPEPDLGQVRRRAGRLRARRRWTALAAGAALLAGAVAVVAADGNDNRAVRVEGPTLTTPTERPTAAGTLPDGLKIELTLDTPTVTLGDDIKATVVLHNDTGEAKTLGTDPIQCAINSYPVLRDAGGTVVVNGENSGGCYDIGVELPADGVRTIPVTVPTTSVVIPPASRDGQYSLRLERPGWSLASVPVEVVLPEGITARLEVPQQSYPSGYSLEGTIVVNNTGGPVDYHVDCHQRPPWQVMLSKDGVVFEVPQATPACAGPGTVEHLASGANRLPFYLDLGYPACGNQADGLAQPACTGNPPGIPDLAPGRYQIVFRGTGTPFDSIAVPPLEIDVHSRA